MNVLPHIINLPLGEGETEHGSRNEVVAETALNGDDEYVSPMGDAAVNAPQENAGRVALVSVVGSAGRVISSRVDVNDVPGEIWACYSE